LRKRVGAFLRGRRTELGLSQGDIIRALGYTSLNSVSNLETGREGLPPKRIYAWADILQLPRDAFFRFVTGETEKMDTRTADRAPEGLTSAESELLAAYRKLSAKYQGRLREQAQEYLTLARANARAKRATH
jgi:transcriptional regulator with XRE-family HTH domain